MEKAKILIVVDTQNDFADGSLGSKEAVASIGPIVQKILDCKKKGYFILDTMDTHDLDYPNTNEGRHLPVAHCVRNTKGWETVPVIRAVLDQCNAVDIYKDRFGHLDLITLVKQIAAQQVGKPFENSSDLEIMLIGWCTDICIISNALILKAAFPEAEIVVDSKCCAGVTPELHDAALSVMKSCQITVI